MKQVCVMCQIIFKHLIIIVAQATNPHPTNPSPVKTVNDFFTEYKETVRVFNASVRLVGLVFVGGVIGAGAIGLWWGQALTATRERLAAQVCYSSISPSIHCLYSFYDWELI